MTTTEQPWPREVTVKATFFTAFVRDDYVIEAVEAALRRSFGTINTYTVQIEEKP